MISTSTIRPRLPWCVFVTDAEMHALASVVQSEAASLDATTARFAAECAKYGGPQWDFRPETPIADRMVAELKRRGVL